MKHNVCTTYNVHVYVYLLLKHSNNIMVMSYLLLQVSVDSLSWEFHVSTLDDSNITEPPKVCVHTHTDKLQWNLYIKNTSV